jgi:hypothetical protein
VATTASSSNWVGQDLVSFVSWGFLKLKILPYVAAIFFSRELFHAANNEHFWISSNSFFLVRNVFSYCCNLMTFLLSLGSFWGCEFSVLNCKTHMYSTEEETDMAVELEARCRVKYVADLDCCISEQFSCWALASSKLVLKLDSTKPKGSFSHIVLWILHWVVQFSLLRCGIIRKLIQWIPVANRMSFVTGWRFCVMVCSDFGQIVICLSAPTVQS